MLVRAAIRAHYAVEDWQFDIGNAFQATRTDSPDSQHLPELYYEQAKEFEERGPNGEKLVAEIMEAAKTRTALGSEGVPAKAVKKRLGNALAKKGEPQGQGAGELSRLSLPEAGLSSRA